MVQNESLKWSFFLAILSLSLAYFTRTCSPWWCCILLGTGIAWLIYAYYRSLTIVPKGRAVVITGCDTGFGHSLARKLHEMEFTTFACCLDKKSNGALALQEVGKETDRLHVIQLDVTSQKDIDDARQYVENNLPEHGLWAVVNNAGIAVNFAYLEWNSFEEFEKLMAVNLFGVIRMTKSFLPLIRKSQGRIVNVSSILGRVAQPLSGVYCITKFGIEAFSDVLRLEMKPFNVKVSTIEPGNFVSVTNVSGGENFAYLGRRSWEKLDESVQNDYGESSLERIANSSDVLVKMSAKDNSRVVNAMADAVYRVHPKTHYFEAAPMEKLFTYAMQFLPASMTDPLRPYIFNAILYFTDRLIQ